MSNDVLDVPAVRHLRRELVRVAEESDRPPARPPRVRWVAVAAAAVLVAAIVGGLALRSRGGSEQDLAPVDEPTELVVTPRPDLPGPVHQGAAVAATSSAVVVWGGQDDGFLGSGWVLTDEWSPTAASPLSNRSDAWAVALGDRVLIAGGYGGARGGVFHDSALYDPTTDTWTEPVLLPEVLPGIRDVGIRDLIAVGDDAYALVDVYDSPRVCCHQVVDSRLLRFDGEAGRWVDLFAPPRHADNWALATDGSDVYLVASRSVTIPPTMDSAVVPPADVLFRYDPERQQWITLADDLGWPVPGFTAGALYVEQAERLVVWTTEGEVRSVDPVTGALDPARRLPMPNSDCGSHLLPLGDLVVAWSCDGAIATAPSDDPVAFVNQGRLIDLAILYAAASGTEITFLGGFPRQEFEVPTGVMALEVL